MPRKDAQSFHPMTRHANPNLFRLRTNKLGSEVCNFCEKNKQTRAKPFDFKPLLAEAANKLGFQVGSQMIKICNSNREVAKNGPIPSHAVVFWLLHKGQRRWWKVNQFFTQVLWNRCPQGSWLSSSLPSSRQMAQ